MTNLDIIVKDPAPVVLVGAYEDSGVKLAIRFWADNEHYWNAYFAVNAAIKRLFNENGITIPYPQRVVTLNEKIPKLN